MLILGAHISISDGFASAAKKTGLQYGCNTMQIFTKSPRGGNVKPLQQNDVVEFKYLCKKYNINHVFAHSSYLINLAKSLKSFPWMWSNLQTDFHRLHALGGQGVVVHIGKALETERKKAIDLIIENAKFIIEMTKDEPLDYILENTAGQGSEIGFKLEELAEVWKGLAGFSPRIKTCLDTAHIWAAGYDISTNDSVQKVMKDYDQMIGIKNLACIHFNDSKKPLDSRLDRHENIGTGCIGKEGLTAIAKLAQLHSIPLILETPEADGRTHEDDVKVVRELMAA